MYLKIIFFLFILFSVDHAQVLAQDWKALGPESVPGLLNPKDRSLNFARGIGRVANLRFMPGETKNGEEPVMFLGTPYGGLWRLDPGAEKWMPENTDYLPHIGIADIAINPKNTDIRYISTGDPDCIMDPNGPALSSEFCQSRGIVKSIDGGKTWSDTAIGNWYNKNNELESEFWNFPSRKIARRILIDPKCPERLNVVIHTYTSATKTYDGLIYQSKDGGKNWYLKLFAEDAFLKDLEYKPDSRKVIYTSGRSVYKSQNAGKSWKVLNQNGLPHDSLVKRIEIACAPSDNDFVYALVIYDHGRNGDIYLSTDDAENFTKIVSAQSSPEWRTAMAVSPVNAELVFFSAGNKVHRLYKRNEEWRQEYTGGFIHDDVHELTCLPASQKLYAGTDGGLHVSSDSGRSWKDLSYGLNMAECWSVAVSQSGPLSVISGLQDCGTIIYKQETDSMNGWWIVRGGDGMATAFDHLNDKLVYANDGSNKLIARSTDAGLTWSRNLLPTREEGALYQRPFVIDPLRQGVLYTGLQNVYKSNNYGDSWQKFSEFGPGLSKERVVAIALSLQDTNIIYAAFSNPVWHKDPIGKLFKTSDAGSHWKDISKGLKGVSWTNITSIVVNPEDSNHVYVGFRGGWDYKVMKSEDGGETWENYSDGLESDCDVNAMIIDQDDQHTIYIATHHGVYKRGKGESGWKKFGTGLPRVMVSALDIRYKDKVLYAGTHGRGVWYIKLKE